MDFYGDLYGQTLRVDFLRRLRDAKKFTSAEELVVQMHRDIAEIRSFFGVV
jgi:riboflavin kinase/FMN adenylyltransferase